MEICKCTQIHNPNNNNNKNILLAETEFTKQFDRKRRGRFHNSEFPNEISEGEKS